jgi:catechol 2,3-dioxygenase-like lactoylglutathione lyase family enzyme
MLARFDHITLAVQDLDAAVAAYRLLLGAEPSWRGSHPQHGSQSAMFGLGNALLELVAPLGADEASQGLRDWVAANGEGLQALAFGTDDAASCSAELRERGLRATPPQAGSARGADGRERVYQTIELSPRATRGVSVFIVQRPEKPQEAQLAVATPALAGASLEPVPLWAANAPVAAGGVERLDHVVVRSSDLENAKSLYGEALGIRLALDRSFGDHRMLFFRIGGVTVEVVQGEGQATRDTLYGAAYRVRDIEAVHARLSAAGLSVSDVRPGRKAGTSVIDVRNGTCGVPTLFIRDPSRD